MLSDDLRKNLIEFRNRRDWKKFHTPKDLALSLVIEAAELLENFQWKTDEEVSRMLQSESRERISEKIADIIIYLTYFCHDFGMDMNKIVIDKLKKNEEKYPAHRVRGSAKKYDEY
ncbi:MAG: nucleotide pyrophosphohydrolase [Nitrospiraceae bacterium]|nr:MAG: nucleotide pyrophosphohydrolase [Nitrospiraceae bacterium]